MITITKRGKGLFNSWWWTVDRITLTAILIIIGFSAIMAATASPAIADRIGLESFYFVRRQLVYLLFALSTIFAISCLSLDGIKKLALGGFAACLVLLVVVLFIGVEIKGARRWLNISGFSMQPSEFIKPFFIVLTGWILSRRYVYSNFPSFRLSFILYGLVISLLILQPDFGMVVTVSTVWAGQLFLAGISMVLIMAVCVLAVAILIGAYMFLPHVAKRINSFLDPSGSENYQIKKSMEALANGGLYGKGPGEGTVKQLLPDSHTDFIFAVVGEELGAITCLVVIGLFAFIVIRGFIKMSREREMFVAFAVSGLLMQFGMQAIINMGVALHLLPTKGMTLPFISYGGSSTIAISIAVGMILAMTRKRFGVIRLGMRGNSMKAC
jgi:cell division protein FtsW